MQYNDIVKFEGIYEFQEYKVYKNAYVKGNKYIYKNVLVQNYFTNIFKAIKGESSDLEILTFRTGDDNTAATRNDTALGNEIFSKSITQSSYSTTAIQIKTTLLTTESNFNILEVGLFTSGDGLISRAVVDIDKNSSTQYLVTYTLTPV